MEFLNRDCGHYRDIDETNVKIINKLNKLLGSDVKNLHKLPHYVCELKKTEKQLEENLLKRKEDGDTNVTSAVKNTKIYISNINNILEESKNIENEMKGLKLRAEAILKDIQPHLEIVSKNEIFKKNYEYASQITEISKSISENMKTHRNRKALEDYKKLRNANSILSNSDCEQLIKFSSDSKKQWTQKLLKTVTEDFKKILAAIKWPFLREDSKILDLAPELNEALAVALEYFCAFDDDPDIHSIEQEVPSIVQQFDNCYPIKMFLKSIEIRFLYHFSGDRATNNKESPHWYFTQLLKWASLNEAFMERVVQPKLPSKYIAKNEFLKGLIRLAVTKLVVDLPHVVSDDDLFSTTVQETLNFHEEMISIGYPSFDSSIVCVLTQPQIFRKWIVLEEKFSQQLLDEFISSPMAFTAEEPNGICRCAEQLFLLLQGITNRYKQLPQPGHKIQFFELQLEILDSYRLRIVQLKGEISNPTSSDYSVLLNTVHYVISTLEDWNDIPFFIELNYFRKRFSDFEAQLRAASVTSLNTDLHDGNITNYIIDAAAQEWTFKQDAIDSFNLSEPSFSNVAEIDGAFDGTVELYEHVKSEMLRVLKNHALTEVRAKSYAYRKEKWFSNNFNVSEESEPLDLTPSVCLMLEVLVKQLKSLKNHLAIHIFDLVWKSLASALDKFLYEELILENNFSALGSTQLHYDIKKGFFPLFSEFTKNPENNFILLKESLILLTLPAPTALLLRDTLNIGRDDRDFPTFAVSPAKALEERNIFHFTVKEAEAVLKLRIDLVSL